MAAIVIIPARFGSSRFPAKILASETGRPLIQHVVERARQARRAVDVMVATDDERIAAAMQRCGARCVMTSPAHQSGTDRIAEAAAALPEEIDLVVNVQGDEPEIEPAVIDGLIERLESSPHPMATAATPFPDGADPADPNLVKVVLAQDGSALYFSRCPIPFARDGAAWGAGGVAAPHAHYLHLGIYAYRRPFLLKFASWPPTPLELTEKLEQLRALERGVPISVLIAPRAAHGIDTPEQYAAFVQRWRTRQTQAGGQSSAANRES